MFKVTRKYNREMPDNFPSSFPFLPCNVFFCRGPISLPGVAWARIILSRAISKELLKSGWILVMCMQARASKCVCMCVGVRVCVFARSFVCERALVRPRVVV